MKKYEMKYGHYYISSSEMDEPHFVVRIVCYSGHMSHLKAHQNKPAATGAGCS